MYIYQKIRCNEESLNYLETKLGPSCIILDELYIICKIH
jgi:hypothetical protein